MAASGNADNRLGFGVGVSPHDPEVAWRNIYDHPRRGPMLLEGAPEGDNRIRCSSVVWHVSGWRHRQTAWHGRWERLSDTQIALTFSCRLRPDFCPCIVFDWVEEAHCFLHDSNAILLRNASVAEQFRVTKFPLLTVKDLKQGEELDEQLYLKGGSAEEREGIDLNHMELNQQVYEGWALPADPRSNCTCSSCSSSRKS